MILRVQSAIGTKRIECQITDSTAAFFEKVKQEFDLPSVLDFSIFKNRDKSWEVHFLERKSLSYYNLKHGDMLYMALKDPAKLAENKPPSPLPSTSSANIDFGKLKLNQFLGVTGEFPKNAAIVEDEVDKILYTQDGYIPRQRDKLCQHGSHAKCVHCAPIEPYNDGYLQEHNIKHLSFHSYLRKVTGGIDKGKFAALENISCKIKSGCREHVPWPHGICTKCQPNAVTLNRQIYRHTDNVMFENPSLVERFLDYWRNTGNQRMGFLYGHYEVLKDVPLGIKAVVVAVYEPPQENGIDFIKLTTDSNREVVDEIASHLGLQQIGWVFTDLIAEDLQKGTVKHLRGADSYFLSAQECIMAGHLQALHPNACRYSPDGFFGSKFVTLCVTGDKDNRVHLEGYQVSNQCMALVRDQCLVPTKDRPELGYVRESSNKQYVPDVFYKIKDNYGNEVTELARPLPIEYLLVDVPVSTPNEPCFTFYSDASIKPFPVENRYIDGQIQDFGALATYLRQFKPDQFLEAVSDFHVLLYIATMDTLPLRDAMEPLLEAVRTQNRELASQWARSEQWATVEQIISAQGMDMDAITSNDMNVDQPSAMGGGATSQAAARWTCRHCTFLNSNTNSNCEICGLPQ